MRKASAFMVALLCATRLLAADHGGSVVSWRGIVGVISAPGIDNPVAVTKDSNGNVLSQIHSGTLPWVTRSGSAQVDLATGAAQFNVRGLVFIGGNATGTAGPLNQLVGTLVCNPGSTAVDAAQAIVDTPPVGLSALGNASFSGELTAPVPSPCDSPLFLLRIGPAFGAFAGRWVAAGVEPRVGEAFSNGHLDLRDRN
jgi:hypothetical protein